MKFSIEVKGEKEKTTYTMDTTAVEAVAVEAKNKVENFLNTTFKGTFTKKTSKVK
jgi:hypothetical protein